MLGGLSEKVLKHFATKTLIRKISPNKITIISIICQFTNNLERHLTVSSLNCSIHESNLGYSGNFTLACDDMVDLSN